MKGLIKLEALRSKLSTPPTRHLFREFVTGVEHHVKPATIDKMKAILEQDHKNNIAWLEGRKKAYADKPKAK